MQKGVIYLQFQDMVKIYDFSLFGKDYFCIESVVLDFTDFNIIENNCTWVRMNKFILLVRLIQSQEKSVPMIILGSVLPSAKTLNTHKT